MREHRQRTGETLSLTAFVVTCVARAVAENPELNAFRRGRKLILLDDITISVLIEREIEGEKIPEPFGIRAAQTKTYRQIHEEIRAAQHHSADHLGSLSGMGWVRFIPGFLLRTFIRFASRSTNMVGRYGAVSIEAREQLCLTVSFDHEIVDGAPAARFVRRLAELISSGDLLLEGDASTVEKQ